MSDEIVVEDDEMGTVQALLSRAQRGDVSVLPELQRYLDEHPVLWLEIGNLGIQTERCWIQLISSEDLLLAESLRRTIRQLRVQLVGSTPSPMLQMMGQRAIIAWLQTHHAGSRVGPSKHAA